MNDLAISNLNLIHHIETLSNEASGQVAEKSDGVVGSSFKNYFEKAINSVDEQQKMAHKIKSDYTTEASNVSLSQVMVQMQKAQVSLSALVAVRNKILEGYKSILEMNL